MVVDSSEKRCLTDRSANNCECSTNFEEMNKTLHQYTYSRLRTEIHDFKG